MRAPDQEADVTDGFAVVELVEVIGTPPSPKTERAFHTLGWQNPMHCRLHRTEDRVLRLSDLLTRPQRLKLEYNEIVWRPHGIDDALRLWLAAPPGRSRSWDRDLPRDTILGLGERIPPAPAPGQHPVHGPLVESCGS